MLLVLLVLLVLVAVAGAEGLWPRQGEPLPLLAALMCVLEVVEVAVLVVEEEEVEVKVV